MKKGQARLKPGEHAGGPGRTFCLARGVPRRGPGDLGPRGRGASNDVLRTRSRGIGFRSGPSPYRRLPQLKGRQKRTI
eukprot:6650579-Pyramimonas_sp.AAC.2